MKLNEFKAWFEGFAENVSGAPNEEQWARIKARVAEIDGVGVTERVYVDRYWPSIYPRYQPYYGPIWSASPAGSALTAAGVKSAMEAKPQWEGVSAMYAAGKAEASL